MVNVTRRWVGALGLLALGWALPLQAAWQLDPAASRVNATLVEITPDGPVPHQHQVRRLEGSIDSQGNLRLPLRLNQLDVMERLGPLPPWLGGLTDKPVVTLTTQLSPKRLESLAVGESLTETLLFGVQSQQQDRQEPIELTFIRETPDRVRITNAQRLALDSRELMANPTARSILLLLGYEQLGDEIPVTLEATLENNDE